MEDKRYINVDVLIMAFRHVIKGLEYDLDKNNDDSFEGIISRELHKCAIGVYEESINLIERIWRAENSVY